MLSAFQKSIRGSDVDAALHYLARLIVSGDYDSIYRRMIVIAYEDIGLANPGIGPKVIAAIEASERVGYPELIKPLSVVIIEMALSPKSNSANCAIEEAISDIENGNVGRIPEHIRTTSPDYKYPHNYPNYWVKQQYLPNNLKNKKYYEPRKNKFETEMYKFNQSIKK
jgi:putative ATPase